MTMWRIAKRLARSRLALLIALVAFAAPALAMRVSPMIIEMESRGSGAVARIEVQNINPGKLAFETRVYRMEMDREGNITEAPADADFVIFPPQGILPAGGRQVVRLEWVGDTELATSQAYYVSVEQLPVAFAPGVQDSVGAQVQVLYNMRALVVVAPPNAKPDVSAASVQQANYQPSDLPGTEETPPVQDGVKVVLRNEGRRHAMMSNFGWQLEGKDRAGNWRRVDLSPEELNRIVGTAYVPGMGERTFYLPVPDFGPGPIKLTFVR